MSKTCTKCKNSIPDNEELGIVAAKYLKFYPKAHTNLKLKILD